MSNVSLLSLVAMLGWLIMAIGAYRAHRVGTSKTIVMILAWVAIFFLVAAVFTAIA